MRRGSVSVFNILQAQRKKKSAIQTLVDFIDLLRQGFWCSSMFPVVSIFLCCCCCCLFVMHLSLKTTHHLTSTRDECVCQCRSGSLVSCTPGPRTAPRQIHIGSRRGDEMTLSCSHFCAPQHWVQKGCWHHTVRWVMKKYLKRSIVLQKATSML